ncbi:molybdate ABC transporter substrate-binding protein [Demequina sp. NBRC 110057]|uniref:molybdate ABC transporter substrate-binding protein n=1 Tax=Demequina sp. NBRC 110057 TaxID=1570346 RepID=UPI000A0224F5|nr:molybdate ABC transporter substrate-binding protein [Demequina sp. NBRC 110057]
MTARLAALTAGAAAAALLAGCTAGADAGASASATDTREITVHAAASLTAAMTDIAAGFEAEHPGVTVRLNVGGSSGLATQIIEGAPGDVFASADQAQMTVVTDEELAEPPVTFATNTLTIAVPAGNPAGITGLDDLDDQALDVVVCAAPVPCGAVAAGVEEAAGVTLSPVSEEQSVTDVLAKVTSGQADAGLVYTTDVAGSGGEAEAVPLGGGEDVAAAAGTSYPIARLAQAAEPELADQFIAAVLSDEGEATLASYGFGPA